MGAARGPREINQYWLGRSVVLGAVTAARRWPPSKKPIP